LYHDDVGGNGDYFSGVYTGPDGKVQTGTSTATASGARSSSASQGAKTTAAGQATFVGAASASTGSARAAASSAAAVYYGANVGLVGLVAGLIV
jgi:hypothetical protein